MKRSIVLHESRTCADGRLLWFVAVLGALVLALALATTAAAATTYDWDNWDGDGDFSNATNWRPGGGPPGAFDVAIFDGQLENRGIDNYGVDVPHGTEVTELQVIDAAVVDMLIGDGTTSSKFYLKHQVGDSPLIGDSIGDTATLNLRGGWLDTYYATIGGRATFNLINPGSYWDSTSVLINGDNIGNTAGVGLGLGAQAVAHGNLVVGSDTGSGRVVVDGTMTFALGLLSDSTGA